MFSELNKVGGVQNGLHGVTAPVSSSTFAAYQTQLSLAAAAAMAASRHALPATGVDATTGLGLTGHHDLLQDYQSL